MKYPSYFTLLSASALDNRQEYDIYYIWSWRPAAQTPIACCCCHIQTTDASCSVLCAGWRRARRGCKCVPSVTLAHFVHLPSFPPFWRKHRLSFILTPPPVSRCCDVRSSKPRSERLGRWRPSELPEAGPHGLHGCGWPWRLSGSVHSGFLGRVFPLFIIIPIISRGGGSCHPSSCPRRLWHSPFLASDAIWT